MARDLVMDVIAKSDTRGLTATAKAMEDLADDSNRTGRSFADMGDESQVLDRRIAELRRNVADLGREFIRTGDADVFKNLRQDRGELSKLQRIRKELDEFNGIVGNVAGAGARVGVDMGESTLRGLLATVRTLPAELGPVGVAAGITLGAGMAVTLGAVVSGAVLGGVGVGGIAGGIAAASQDARVKSAASDLGESLKREFARAGSPFVMPLLESLEIFDQGLKDLHIDKALAPLAPYLPVLAQGLADFAKQAMPGFTKAFAEAGPVVAVLADEMPRIGAALGGMVAEIAESEGAMDGLRLASQWLIDVFRALGWTVHHLSGLYHEAIEQHRNLREALGQTEVVGRQLTKTQYDGVSAVEALRDQYQGLGASAEEARAASEALFRTTMDGIDTFQEAGRVAREVAGANDLVTESVRANGTSLDIATEAGRRNRAMLDQLIDIAQRRADVVLKETGSQQAANAEFDRTIGKLLKIAEQAGLSAAELKKLKEKITIPIEYKVTGAPPNNAGTWADFARQQGARGYASGTSSALPGWAMVGENGPEWVRFGGGEVVLPNGRTPSPVGPPASSGFGSSSPRTVAVVGGDAVMALLLEKLREQVRAEGGNVQIVLGSA